MVLRTFNFGVFVARIGISHTTYNLKFPNCWYKPIILNLMLFRAHRRHDTTRGVGCVPATTKTVRRLPPRLLRRTTAMVSVWGPVLSRPDLIFTLLLLDSPPITCCQNPPLYQKYVVSSTPFVSIQLLRIPSDILIIMSFRSGIKKIMKLEIHSLFAGVCSRGL